MLFCECSIYTAAPHLGVSIGWCNLSVCNQVGNEHPPTTLFKNPINLFESIYLVHSQVNDTVADYDIHRIIINWNSLFYVSFSKFNVGEAMFLCISSCSLKHFVSHIYSNNSTHFVTFFADKNTSIPAPEPRSTTVSPCCKSANFTGAPQPTPRIDASGTDSSSLVSYPTTIAAWAGESTPPTPLEQQPGAQQEEDEELESLLLSCNAILPYVLRIVFLISCC